MEAILATRISYMAMIHNSILPKTHFKDRRKLCIETAIYNFLEKVYAAWNKNENVSLFMINVFAAYLNTFYKSLLYNLCKKKLL